MAVKNRHMENPYYASGYAAAKYLAASKSATAIRKMRQPTMSCPRGERDTVIEGLFGFLPPIGELSDYWRGLIYGLGWQQHIAGRVAEVQRIHKAEQADAERRRLRSPCVDCGKRTVCPERCRKCSKKQRLAERQASRGNIPKF